MNKAYIGVPLGDPAGIGPEIVVKSIAKEETNTYANIVVFGNKEILENIISLGMMDKYTRIVQNCNCKSSKKRGI